MEPELSEQTKLEMELGRKTAAANAAALASAEQMRAAEAAVPEDDEAAKAAAEAKPLPVETAGFPVAKEPYQPKKSKG